VKPPVAALPAVFRGKPLSKKDLLALSPGERLASVSDIFLFPAVVGDALKEFEYAFYSSGVSGLSPNLLLSGPDGSGKTRLIRYFWTKHPPVERDPFDEQPVVIATPTARVDAVGLSEAVLGDAGWPQSLARMGEKMSEIQIQHFVAKSKTRVLIFNRAHLLAEGRSSIGHETAVFLSNLIDATCVSVVLVGNENLVDLIGDCSLLRRKFDTRLEFRPIKFGRPWIDFLAGLERDLPFVGTDLLVDDMPLRLHIATDSGRIPEMMRLTFKAARCALLEKKSAELKREHFFAAFALGPWKINPFGKIDPEFARRDESAAASARGDAVRANNRAISQ
jgi:hypothetical protein